MAGGFINSLAGQTTFTVLSACDTNQASYEDEQVGHGYFTQALIWGLVGKLFEASGLPQGEAFPQESAYLDLTALAGYVTKTFQSHKWDSAQSPQFIGKVDLGENLVLAYRDVPPPPPLKNADYKMMALSLSETYANWVAHNYVDAADFATTALRINPKNADALAWRAQANLSLGYPNPARADAQEALKIEPDHPHALQVMGLLDKKEKEPDIALFMLLRAQEVLESHPDRWSWLTAGDLAVRRIAVIGYIYGRDKDAPDVEIEYYTKALNITGTSDWLVGVLYLIRGRAYSELNQYEQALDDFGHALAVEGAKASTVAKVLINRGGVYSDLSQPHKALADYTAVVELKDVPAKLVAKALVSRGIVYSALNQPQEAIVDYTTVIELQGAPAELVVNARVNRGIVYEGLKELTKAVADFTAVIELKDASVEQVAKALNNRGLTYSDLNQPLKAIADYTAIIQLKDAPEDLVTAARTTLAGMQSP